MAGYSTTNLITTVNTMPDWFAVAIVRVLSGDDQAAASTPEGAAGAKEFLQGFRAKPEDLRKLIYRKYMECKVYEMTWKRQYPTASAEAILLAMQLSSDALSMKDKDSWCHFYKSEDVEHILMQYWHKTDPVELKPMLVIECVVGGNSSKLLLNEERMEAARACFEELNKVGYACLVTRGIATSSTDFKLDTHSAIMTRGTRQTMGDVDFGTGMY